jgi:RNA polymerase sigma-70 factor (ECF subfamily)
MTARGHPASEDLDLVQRALAGSQDAYRDLLLRYQRPVLSLIRRMVRNSSQAEDLAQEVFLKAFRALGSYDQGRKFSSWLFKIAHNTAIDQLRRKELVTVPLETPDRDEPDLVAMLPDASAETPAGRAQRRDLAAAIEGAVGSLKPLYREVVVLRYQEGLMYEEIAEVTGLPLGTVKTHLFRARKAMVAHLEAHGWQPGNE